KYGDGSWWCMNKACSEQFYPSGNDEPACDPTHPAQPTCKHESDGEGFCSYCGEELTKQQPIQPTAQPTEFDKYKTQKDAILASQPTAEQPYRDGEPCKHKGCLSHITHPCEGCGR